MITTTSTTTKKIVTLANAVPDEVIKNAQVMIVTGETWHIYTKGQRAHGTELPAPLVTCPIVDVSRVEDDDKFSELIKLCILPSAGVVAMDTLLDGLVQLGGIVTNKPCPVCEGAQIDCTDCRFGAIQ